MENLLTCTPHYIHCIKSNDDKKVDLLDEQVLFFIYLLYCLIDIDFSCSVSDIKLDIWNCLKILEFVVQDLYIDNI